MDATAKNYTPQLKKPKDYLLHDPSTQSLLIANIFVIILALAQNWDITTILWVYWAQSVIIGFFNFLRILALKNFSTENFTINNRPVEPTEKTKLFTASFFAIHYGLFHLIYTIFISSLFPKLDMTEAYPYVLLGAFVFFINHFYSFLHNKKRDEELKQNIGTIMFTPYARIIPMHLIVMVGALIGGRLLLVLFLFLKTMTDLFMHVAKHADFAQEDKVY